MSNNVAKTANGNVEERSNSAEDRKLDAETTKIYAEATSAIMQGTGMFMESKANARKTSAEAFKIGVEAVNLHRQEDRADRESFSNLQSADIDRKIREDLHVMSREIHDDNVKVSHVENSARAKTVADDVIKNSYDTLIYIKQKEKELLELGATKEEIEEMRRQTEDYMITTNRSYQEGLLNRKRVLELEIEREIIKQKNLISIKDIFADIVKDLYNEGNNKHLEDILAVHRDSEGKEFDKLPEGYFRIRRQDSDNIVIQFLPWNYDSSKDCEAIEDRPVLLESKLYDEGPVKPEELDIISIDGKELSLKEIGAYKNDTFNFLARETPFDNYKDWLNGKSDKIEEGIKNFYISSTAREEIHKAACEARGRDFLTLREKNDLQVVYEEISKGIARQFNNQELRAYVTGQSDSFLGKTADTIGYGLGTAADVVGAVGSGIGSFVGGAAELAGDVGSFVGEKASDAISTGFTSIKKKLFSK